jgi:hypothetical protein
MPNKLTAFEKPTIEQIEAQFAQIGVQPARQMAEAFFYHYESNGWKVGQTKMTNWKAACQTWKRSPYRTQQSFGQRNAPVGQPKQQIAYVQPNTEQGEPMPEEMRGLFGSIGQSVDKLVNKLTGK